MASPLLSGWQGQILSGIGAPVTPENLRAFDAWTQAESGTASNNPFNTTQYMPGASVYNTLSNGAHVYGYQTPQQGIRATIDTLRGPIGNYGPIVAALRAGHDPLAVARAIAGSQWGTGAGVLRQLSGMPPIPAGQAAIPGASPRAPSYDMPQPLSHPLQGVVSALRSPFNG